MKTILLTLTVASLLQANILIDVSHQENKMKIYENSSLIKEYNVSTARKGFPRPQGLGKITKIELNPNWYPTQKTLDYFREAKKINLPSIVPAGHPQNYMGTFKMTLNHSVNGKQIYRIHGTLHPETIGTNESSGCIRMKNEEGQELAKILLDKTKGDLSKITVNLS